MTRILGETLTLLYWSLLQPESFRQVLSEERIRLSRARWEGLALVIIVPWLGSLLLFGPARHVYLLTLAPAGDRDLAQVVLALAGLLCLVGSVTEGVAFGVAGGPVACIYFGLTGALIVANFNPIIAVLTATHPLAPSFFFANMAYTIPFTFIFRYVARSGRAITYPVFAVICIICQFGPTTVLLALWTLLLQLPTWQVVLFYIIGIAVAIPGSAMGYYFWKYVERSGLME